VSATVLDLLSHHSADTQALRQIVLPSPAILPDVTRARVLAGLSVAAFAALALALGSAGVVGPNELGWAVASVAVAFLPGAVLVPGGWRRRAAEAALLPAAYALTMVDDPTMRRMMVPPLLVLAALVAARAALRTAPSRVQPYLVAALAVAGRLACGLGLTGEPIWRVLIAVALPAAITWMATRVADHEIGVVVALLLTALPLQHAPVWAFVLAGMVAVGAPYLRGLAQVGVARAWSVAGLSVALIGSALGSWGGLGVTRALPDAGWLAAVTVGAAVVFTPRLPTMVAGAAWLLVTFALGPVQPAPPDRAGFLLGPGQPSAQLPASEGRGYVIELSLANAAALAADTPVATVSYGGETVVLRAGVDTAEWAHERADVKAVVSHPLPKHPVWRPGGVGRDAFWGVAGRTVLPVANGIAPVLTRQVPQSIGVSVATAGPSRPTPPRTWPLAAWILAAALAVAALQLISGTWRSPVASFPWALLVGAAVVARMPVEPLRLVLERHGVDVALVALVTAWLPAARAWFARRRIFVAAAALLVPLALATPQLTPPMYGDEPFHLVVLSSLAHDWDIDLANNLDIEHHPFNRIYVTGRIFLHSPVLGLLLLPGFSVLGRNGALLLLALAGAGVVALVCRRATSLGVPRSRIAILASVMLMSYPLATYCSQIWVEVPGALATAAGLALLVGVPQRRGVITAGAVLAGAMKARLALTSAPLAMLAWWPRDRSAKELRRALLAAGLLTVAVFGASWVFLGGPLGLRRLADLIPKRVAQPFIVIGGLLFDPAGGLAYTAPLLLLALGGVALLWRRAGRGERAVLLGGVVTVALLLHSLEWYGGGAPPARYLVPLLPAFALAGAMLLRWGPRWRALAFLLLPPTVLSWAVLLTRPHFSVNPGDGGYWLADALSRRFAAGARHLFPSFLVPSVATWVVPAVIVAVTAAALLACRRPLVGRTLARCTAALWLAVAAALVVAVRVRTDSVVEIEEPQVERIGGRTEPPEGTFSRFTVRNGWRVANGDGVGVPLNLPARTGVVVEGWLDGAAQQGATLVVRWDDGGAVTVPWSGRGPGRVTLPTPPGAGRHRLRLTLGTPAGGEAVLDRVLVK
jgi:hypothetical protein